MDQVVAIEVISKTPVSEKRAAGVLTSFLNDQKVSSSEAADVRESNVWKLFLSLQR